MTTISPAPVSELTGVSGWESPNEQNLLAILATLINPKVIVEIGSEYGMSASIWSMFAPQTSIFCIDINPEAPFMDNLKNANLGQNVIPIYGDSMEVSIGWAETCLLHNIPSTNSIDILFIDGDHSYRGAYNDLLAWWDKISPAGIMIMHDVDVSTNKTPHPLHKEVRKAFDDWYATRQNEVEVIASIDTILVCRKVG